jgi:hypothetical protein
MRVQRLDIETKIVSKGRIRSVHPLKSESVLHGITFRVIAGR